MVGAAGGGGCGLALLVSWRDASTAGAIAIAQGHQEAHERLGLGRIERVAVGGHVAAALQHLANDLVLGHARGDGVECGAALPAGARERMAVAALLVLQHQRALALQRSAVAQIGGGMGSLVHASMMGLHGV